MKSIVIFGGGTGLSSILSGLKLFPIDVTAVITVTDDGSSTGILKEELDIPAVGDVGKVLLAMANVDEDFAQLLHYRFQRMGSLYNHPVRNILLAALIDLKGDLTGACKYMSKLLNVRGTVLPLTEERVELVGHGRCAEYMGESEVSRHIKDIDYLTYDHPINVSAEIIEKIADADLIIMSPGSLFTSVIPNLITPLISNAIRESSAPIMYISNLVTQPGETDGYTVSDHIRVLNQHLDGRKVDVVIVNNKDVDFDISAAYRLKERKTLVVLDRQAVEQTGAAIIADDIIKTQEGMIRHDELKTAYLVFSYLMS